MAQQWVKFHAALTKGSKRALTRATRFVFLELCLEARDLDGAIEVRSDLDLPAAVYDLIGGNLTEIGEAMSSLVSAGMVLVETVDGERFITIPSWEKWNRPDTSADRMRKHRDRKRDVTPVTSHSVTPCDERDALEERRGEEKRGEERSARAREAPPPASEEESHIRAALMSSPLLSTADGVEASAATLAAKVRSLPPEARWSDLRAEADEWVAHARKAFQSARDGGQHWSAERALAEVESKAGQRIRYRPKDARLERERERQRSAQWPDGSAKSPAAIETDSLDAEIADADRRLAADRAKRESEPKVDPREMAKLTAGVVAKFTRGAA